MDKVLLPINLEKTRIIKVVEDHEAEILYITVETTEDSTRCRQCGKNITQRHGADRERKIRHLPSIGYDLYILYKPNRYICKNCDNNPTTTARPTWHKKNSSHTNAYEKNILLSLINNTIADICKKEKLSAGEVQGILERNLNCEVNWKTILKLGIIGIDEIALKKGYKDYVTIITSRVNGKNRLLATLPGSKKSTIKVFFRTIPKSLIKTIDGFCTDMYSGYIHAIREIFKRKAIIVIDRFHVAKLYRCELDKFRQKVLKRLKAELTEKEYDELKGATNILRRGNECLSESDKKILNNLFSLAPELMDAYHCAIKLTCIFNTHLSHSEAIEKFNEGIALVRSMKVTCFNKFIKTLKRYKNDIANYFINRNTSAFVEGLNNKVKVTKRRCYGIFNLKHLFQRLHLDISGYDDLLGRSTC